MSFIGRLFRKKKRERKITKFLSPEEAERALATNSDSLVRRDAANALGEVNSVDVVPALAKALLEDSEKYVRQACADALGNIQGAEAEEALLRFIGDPNNDVMIDVRISVMRALSKFDSEKSRKALENALNDDHPEIRSSAEIYTGIKSKKKILCPFLTEFGRCKPPKARDRHTCSWEAMGRGHYTDCYVYKMHTHPGGVSDFMRRTL